MDLAPRGDFRGTGARGSKFAVGGRGSVGARPTGSRTVIVTNCNDVQVDQGFYKKSMLAASLSRDFSVPEPSTRKIVDWDIGVFASYWVFNTVLPE